MKNLNKIKTLRLKHRIVRVLKIKKDLYENVNESLLQISLLRTLYAQILIITIRIATLIRFNVESKKKTNYKKISKKTII